MTAAPPDTRITDFLAASGWQGARRAPLAGDASARRYERVSLAGRRGVLMDTVPGDELSRFIYMTDWLRSAGFSAPDILARAPQVGLLLLEDLGDDLIFDLVTRDRAREGPLYGHVVDFLIALQSRPPPDVLLPLEGGQLAHLTELTEKWYPHRATSSVPLARTIATLFDALDDGARGVSLRDFHAQNALWLPDRQGVARLGILDYQDAVRAHPAYDLVSALQDARRDVDPQIAAAQIARFCTQAGYDPSRFGAIYALLGAQRALRILGIFARLCLGYGKPRYLEFMPRVWAHLQANLRHPALDDLKQLVDAGLHAPSQTMIEEMRQKCGTRPTP